MSTANFITKLPSWAISASFHAVALACLTLIVVAEQPFKTKAPETTIVRPSPRRAKVEVPPDLPRGIGSEKSPFPAAADLPPAEIEAPQVLLPNAIAGDHFEMDTDSDTHDVVEGLPDSTGFKPGEGKGARDPIGLGPGGGTGRFGRPGGKGGNVNMIMRPGGPTEGTEDAVKAGLRWLARHQAEDGGWYADEFSAGCAPGQPCEGPGYGQFDVGLTGLSLLAFLGAGYTHLSRETYDDEHSYERIGFGQVVKRGIRWLLERQDDDGCFGDRTGEFMYNHAISTLAVVEAYGLTNATQYRGPAERALAFLTAAQNPYRGWRYTTKPGDNDTSVSGWCVMALKSAAISGLPASRVSFDGARAWIDSATDEEGVIGYTGKGKTDVVVKGKNEAWRGHPAMTAVGLLCKIFIDGNASDRTLERHAAHLVADPPRWAPRWEAGARGDRPIDFYYWYYGALALYQLDGPEGRHWRKWNEALERALVPTQSRRAAGCEDGSWDPGVDRWGFAGGRVYATAINVLTLEVFYRYERVFGARATAKPK